TQNGDGVSQIRFVELRGPDQRLARQNRHQLVLPEGRDGEALYAAPFRTERVEEGGNLAGTDDAGANEEKLDGSKGLLERTQGLVERRMQTLDRPGLRAHGFREEVEDDPCPASLGRAPRNVAAHGVPEPLRRLFGVERRARARALGRASRSRKGLPE